MSTFLLLVAGVVIGAGVWWWSRTRRRGNRRLRLDREGAPEPVIGGLTVSPAAEEDADIAAALADLSGLVKESRRGERRADKDESPKRRAARRRHPAQMDLSFADEEPLPPADARVIALYVRARDGVVFTGPELLQQMAAVDLRYGEMSIFHHYGVGRLSSATPLFSVANMFEPGAFDLSRIETFNTTGLAFFMTVPARIESTMVFELMLNTAQRLAEALGGEVLDDAREPLTMRAIEQLRATVRGK